jgi:hypothetical protein
MDLFLSHGVDTHYLSWVEWDDEQEDLTLCWVSGRGRRVVKL